MSNRKKKIKETTIENFYDLKVDKVDELVAALKDGGDQPETEVNYEMNANMGVDDPKNVTRTGKQRKFDPYKLDKLSSVPVWLKAIFVKWWFAGMVCFFVMMGLGVYLMYDDLDMLVLTGLVLGLVNELFVNPIFRYMESDLKEYDNYMMLPFPFKAYWTFFVNLIYYLGVIIVVNYIYSFINIYIGNLAVESLLFGTFTVIVDMAFIGIKDGIVALVRRQKNKKKEGAVNV